MPLVAVPNNWAANLLTANQGETTTYLIILFGIYFFIFDAILNYRMHVRGDRHNLKGFVRHICEADPTKDVCQLANGWFSFWDFYFWVYREAYAELVFTDSYLQYSPDATVRPAGRAPGEQASSTAGAPSSSPGSRPSPSCPSGTILAILRSPRGTPAARTRSSFAGRTTEPVWSSKPSSSRRDPKAIGSQTSTPSSRYTYGENAAPMAWGTSTTMAWGTLKKI